MWHDATKNKDGTISLPQYPSFHEQPKHIIIEGPYNSGEPHGCNTNNKRLRVFPKDYYNGTMISDSNQVYILSPYITSGSSGTVNPVTNWANTAYHTGDYGHSELGWFEWNVNMWVAASRGANVTLRRSWRATPPNWTPGQPNGRYVPSGASDYLPAIDPFLPYDWSINFTLTFTLLDKDGNDLGKWAKWIHREHIYYPPEYPPYYPWDPSKGFGVAQWGYGTESSWDITDNITYDTNGPLAGTFCAWKSTVVDEGITWGNQDFPQGTWIGPNTGFVQAISTQNYFIYSLAWPMNLAGFTQNA
jgi:hypothetical protein